MTPRPWLATIARGAVTRGDPISRWFAWHPFDGRRSPWVVASYAAPRWVAAIVVPIR